jgi:hypothetical protein
MNTITKLQNKIEIIIINCGKVLFFEKWKRAIFSKLQKNSNFWDWS